MYKKYIKRLLDIVLSGFALIVLSPVLLIVAILVWRKMISMYGDFTELLEFFPGMTVEQIKLKYMFKDLVSCLAVFAFGAGIFIAVWFFKRHTFVFNPWYILWFSLLLLVFVIIAAVTCIPFFVYSIIQLFPKKKRV